MGRLGLINSVKLVSVKKAPPGQQVFTTSGTFTVPKYVKQVEINLIGGGKAGGNASHYFNPYARFNGGGGGRGGNAVVGNVVSVTQLSSIAINVGAAASDTTFGDKSTAGGTEAHGGGGAYEGYSGDGVYHNVNAAGNGDNGPSVNGTIYGSGGGGGGANDFGGASGGIGAGNGGAGGFGCTDGGNGGYATGGAGGGGGMKAWNSVVCKSGGSGGTGVAIIKW